MNRTALPRSARKAATSNSTPVTGSPGRPRDRGRAVPAAEHVPRGLAEQHHSRSGMPATQLGGTVAVVGEQEALHRPRLRALGAADELFGTRGMPGGAFLPFPLGENGAGVSCRERGRAVHDHSRVGRRAGRMYPASWRRYPPHRQSDLRHLFRGKFSAEKSDTPAAPNRANGEKTAALHPGKARRETLCCPALNPVLDWGFLLSVA